MGVGEGGGRSDTVCGSKWVGGCVGALVWWRGVGSGLLAALLLCWWGCHNTLPTPRTLLQYPVCALLDPPPQNRVQGLYLNTSRELKRLDALAFSPIFQHYGESLAGLPTIRAFQRQQLFEDINRVRGVRL